MTLHRFGAMFLVGAATAIAFNTPRVVAQDIPAWVTSLSGQLADEHKCELNYMTNVREFDVGASTAVDLRAHCLDGRAFDVSGHKDGPKFEIRACDVSQC